MSGDDKERDRLAILRRRRFLIATAVAGLASTECECENKSQVCLNVAIVQDAAPTPQVCLSPAPPQPDAGDSGTNDGSANG